MVYLVDEKESVIAVSSDLNGVHNSRKVELILCVLEDCYPSGEHCP